VGDDGAPVQKVVEDDQVVAEEEDGVGDIEAVFAGRRYGLEISRRLVGQVADQPPREAPGEALVGSLVTVGEDRLEVADGVGEAVLAHLPARLNGGHAVLHGHRGARLPADERKTAEPLAPLDRFQQETRPVLVEAPVRRHRGLGVGEVVAVDGDEVVIGRQPAHLVEGRRDQG